MAMILHVSSNFSIRSSVTRYLFFVDPVHSQFPTVDLYKTVLYRIAIQTFTTNPVSSWTRPTMVHRRMPDAEHFSKPEIFSNIPCSRVWLGNPSKGFKLYNYSPQSPYQQNGRHYNPVQMSRLQSAAPNNQRISGLREAEKANMESFRERTAEEVSVLAQKRYHASQHLITDFISDWKISTTSFRISSGPKKAFPPYFPTWRTFTTTPTTKMMDLTARGHQIDILLCEFVSPSLVQDAQLIDQGLCWLHSCANTRPGHGMQG